MSLFNCALVLAICIFLFNQGTLCQVQKVEESVWQQGKATQKQYILEPSQIRNFQQARDFCEGQGNGASLAMIKNKEENEAVLSILKEQGTGNSRWSWLGVTNLELNKQASTGRFTWLDGTLITNASFTNWRAGAEYPYASHDGAVIEKNQGKWESYRFEYHVPNTVCERPMKGTSQQVLESLIKQQSEQISLLVQSVDAIKGELRKQPIAFESKMRVLSELMMQQKVGTYSKLDQIMRRLGV